MCTPTYRTVDAAVWSYWMVLGPGPRLHLSPRSQHIPVTAHDVYTLHSATNWYLPSWLRPRGTTNCGLVLPGDQLAGA